MELDLSGSCKDYHYSALTHYHCLYPTGCYTYCFLLKTISTNTNKWLESFNFCCLQCRVNLRNVRWFVTFVIDTNKIFILSFSDYKGLPVFNLYSI